MERGIHAIEKLKEILDDIDDDPMGLFRCKVKIDRVENGILYLSVTAQPKVTLKKIVLNFPVSKENK